MRVTNAMTRNNILWSINRTEEKMDFYNMQVATNKKIQRPSENPIIAIRALKFRANISEVEQYQTNSEDGISWLNTTEQSLSNSTDMIKRARVLCQQAANDTLALSEVEAIVEEIDQIRVQIVNEGNVSYAGRYVFSGYKTETPLVFADASTDSYTITETFSKDTIETIDKVLPSLPPATDCRIESVNRLRLGYDGIDTPVITDPLAGVLFDGTDFTVTEYNSTDEMATTPSLGTPPGPGITGSDVYKPDPGHVHFIKDTGELIFNQDDIDGTSAIQIPADISIDYNKTGFTKNQRIPENYYTCTNNTTGDSFTKPDNKMVYQISYNQELRVNTMGNSVFTSDMVRDLEEIVRFVRDIDDDDSIEATLKKDVMGDEFDKMIGKLDGHLSTIVKEQAVIGSKVNRLELTINRLQGDSANFTELMSKNEDADMKEAVMNLKAQETVYNAALMSSSRLMQNTLLDFLR